MNTQNFKNESGKFPLTTDSLDFIQDQIKLVYGLTDLAGKFIIIREPSGIIPGLVIVNGELLPLTGSKSSKTTKILVSQVDKTITVGDGTEFDGIVRTERMAMYPNETRDIGGVIGGINMGSRIGSAPGTGEYALSKFTVLKNMQTLMSELDEAKKHLMPKGTIIDWYGEVDCDHVPDGFVPCGGFFAGSASNFAPDGAGVKEQNKWKAKYPNIKISSKSVNGSVVGVIITECNGLTIPDLTDRFVVNAGLSYAKGATGGANSVTLTSSQSGLPDSLVSAVSKTTDSEHTGVKTQGTFGYVNGVSYTTKYSHGATAAHENRPPYFALYKLIKVI